MYTNLKFVTENDLVLNGNKLQFYDNDLANIRLFPLAQQWDGLRLTVNYPGYAINHYNQDLSNNSINTFCTQYNQITIKIRRFICC